MNKEDNDSEEDLNGEEKPKDMVRIQYRGKVLDDYLGVLHHLDAPCLVGSFHSSKIENYTTITET